MAHLGSTLVIVKINYVPRQHYGYGGMVESRIFHLSNRIKSGHFQVPQKPKRGAFFCVLSASAQIRVTADNFTRGDVTLKPRKKQNVMNYGTWFFNAACVPS